MMLGAPIALTPKSKSKLNWRDKIKRRSFQSPRPDDYKVAHTPDSRVPSLSNSRGSTPGSRRSHTSTPRVNFPSDDDVFLTALDVLDAQSINDFDLLKDSSVLTRGSLTIPPPPPRNKAVPQFPDPSRQVGPKVKPFVTNSMAIEPLLSECFICHESLETKLETERLVPLSCGDCVHSECLQISALYTLESAVSNGKLSPRSTEATVERTIMPICKGKKCQHEKDQCAVIPLEEAVIEELLSEAMLTLRLTSIPEVPRRNDTPETPTPRHFATPSLPQSTPSFDTPLKITPTLKQGPFTKETSNLKENSRWQESWETTPKAETPSHSRQTSLVYGNRVSRFFMMENFELRVKPEISSLKAAFLPNSPKNVSLPDLGARQKPSFLRKSFPPGTLEPSHVSLEEMRNIAIKHMLSSYAIDLGLLTSLGSLKLVDRLHVSLHNQEFSPQVVYLFTDYLVVGNGTSPCLFPLKTKFSITTPETTVLCFESTNENAPLLKLHCDISSVIEKWGIAVSDTSLVIPGDLITSTLTIDELQRSEKDKKGESEKGGDGEKPEKGRAEKKRTSRSILARSLIDRQRSSHASRTSADLDSEFYKAFSRDSVAQANASDRDVEDFEKELISYGLVPEVITETYETYESYESETSPLHIVRRTSNDIPVLLSYSDSESELGSDSDSDSDSELISEIKNKML